MRHFFASTISPPPLPSRVGQLAAHRLLVGRSGAEQTLATRFIAACSRTITMTTVASSAQKEDLRADPTRARNQPKSLHRGLRRSRALDGSPNLCDSTNS
jgi:hypothetical protein